MLDQLLQASPLGETTKNTAPSGNELFSIPRSVAREAAQLNEFAQQLGGEDHWRLHEISWLQPNGVPSFSTADLFVPAASKNIIESKSLKLYCNSFAEQTFTSAEELGHKMQQDLSRAAGCTVRLDISMLARSAPIMALKSAKCIDNCIKPAGSIGGFELKSNHNKLVQDELCSHIFKSNCPVTNWPDWATIHIKYQGPEIDQPGLLAYFISQRSEQAFHEQCIEKVFSAIWEKCQPEMLWVKGYYTRRGGIDINPWRTLLRQDILADKLE